MRPNEPKVRELCAEFDIEIVPAFVAPLPGQTRAVVSMCRIMTRYGEGHLRLVLSTLAETKGNQGLINEYSLWACSDLVLACSDWIEKDPEDWFQAWDKIPMGYTLWHCMELSGKVHLRYALAGAMYLMLVHYSNGRKANKDVNYNFMRRVKRAEGTAAPENDELGIGKACTQPRLPRPSERVPMERMVELGRELIAIRNKLPRGHFRRWVEDKSGLNYCQAERFIKAAKEAA